MDTTLWLLLCVVDVETSGGMLAAAIRNGRRLVQPVVTESAKSPSPPKPWSPILRNSADSTPLWLLHYALSFVSADQGTRHFSAGILSCPLQGPQMAAQECGETNGDP